LHGVVFDILGAHLKEEFSNVTRNDAGKGGDDGAREGGRLPGLRVTRAALYAELRGRENLQTAGGSPAKK
jgi:hypothetical protein